MGLEVPVVLWERSGLGVGVVSISYGDTQLWGLAQEVIGRFFSEVVVQVVTRTYLGAFLGLVTAAAIALFLWRWLVKVF